MCWWSLRVRQETVCIAITPIENPPGSKYKYDLKTALKSTALVTNMLCGEAPYFTKNGGTYGEHLGTGLNRFLVTIAQHTCAIDRCVISTRLISL